MVFEFLCLSLRGSLGGFREWAVRFLQKHSARAVLPKVVAEDSGRESLCVRVCLYTSMDASPSLKQGTRIRDVIEGKEQMGQRSTSRPIALLHRAARADCGGDKGEQCWAFCRASR